jgi:TrmH family RNA methyltransferase
MDPLTKKQIRDIAELQQASVRRERSRFLIEGSLCVEEALQVGFPMERAFLTPEFLDSESGKRIWQTCRRNLVHIEEVTPGTLQRMSSQDHPQGVLAIGKCQELTGNWADSDEDILLVIPLLSDPGNLGTIFRNAHAFDIRTVWIGDGSVDPWNPKVVRGSMGSLFHLNLHRTPNVINELGDLKTKGISIYALDSNGNTPVSEIIHLPEKTALIIGHEAEGIPDELDALCDKRVILGRSRAGIGSLNVAVATGILLYLLRQ